MTEENNFAVTRSTASLAAQLQIGAAFVWSEKTNVQWALDLAAIPPQEELVADLLADLTTKRGTLDTAVGVTARRGQTILTLAKIKWRNDPAKLGSFQRIHFNSDGRLTILKDALAVESAWEAADPTWVPITEDGTPPVPITLAVFKAQREAAGALLKPESDAEAAWSKQDKTLGEMCAALNRNSIPWYASVTAVFPEGTTLGDMIRSTVPTTYVPPAEPPGPITFTQAASPAAGELTASVTAARAATFDFYRKGPGEAAFVEVVHLSQNNEYNATGLPPGTYLLKAQAHNSGGYGPLSAEQSVVVG